MGSNPNNPQSVIEEKITDPNAPRRITRFLRPRFSLRSMLIGVTVIGFVLAWVVPSLQQYRAVAEIERKLPSAKILFAGEEPKAGEQPARRWYEHFFHTVETVDAYGFFNFGDLDKDLEHRFEVNWQSLPHLRTLELKGISSAGDQRNNPRVNINSSLQRLTSNQKLTSLTISSYIIDDESMALIGQLRNLEELVLDGHVEISDKGIQELVKLKKLKKLSLIAYRGTTVTEDGVSTLAELQDLEQLSLALKSSISVTRFGHLKGMTRLKNLSIPCDKKETDLTFIENLRDLEELTIWDLANSDEALVHLKDLVKLKKLNLRFCDLDGSGFAHLKNLQQLVELDVYQDSPLAGSSTQQLVALRGLEKIQMRVIAATKEDIKQLFVLPKIQSIRVTGNKMTTEDIDELNKIKRIVGWY